MDKVDIATVHRKERRCGSVLLDSTTIKVIPMVVGGAAATVATAAACACFA